MLGVARAGAGFVDVAAEVHAPARAAAVAKIARVAYVDALRGAAVVAMLAANLANVCLHDVPWALAHNQGDVLRAFDLPAPVFQFLLGLSLALFHAERLRRGRSGAAAHADAVRRFALLVLLGMVLDGVGALSAAPRWGVLQTLGLGGLVATALLEVPVPGRVAVAIALLALYSGAANGVVHHDPLSALAFVPLTLVGTLVGDAVASGADARAVARRAAGVASASGTAALALYVSGVPFNKMLGTGSFVALATAVGAASVGVAAWWESRGGTFPSWLLGVGRGALTAWVLLHVLVYYPAWIVFPTWDRLALPAGLAAVSMATAALCASTLVLARRAFAFRSDAAGPKGRRARRLVTRAGTR